MADDFFCNLSFKRASASSERTAIWLETSNPLLVNKEISSLDGNPHFLANSYIRIGNKGLSFKQSIKFFHVHGYFFCFFLGIWL